MQLGNKNIEAKSAFPWMIIIHVLIAVATTIQVLFIVCSTTSYGRSQERMIYNLFIDESDKTATDYKKYIHLFNVQELKNHIKTSVDNYYNIQDSSLFQVNYPHDTPKVYIVFSFINNNLIFKDTPSASSSLINNSIKRQFLFNISNTTLGPFDFPDDEVRLYLNDVTKFTINYQFLSTVNFEDSNHSECFRWNIQQIYDFASRGHFTSSLNINTFSCDSSLIVFNSNYNTNSNNLVWFNPIVIILSSISLIYTWNYIHKIADLYGLLRESFRKKRSEKKEASIISDSEESNYYNPLLDKDLNINKEEEEEPFPIKLNKTLLFDGWSIICLFGNIIQILGSTLLLFGSLNFYAFSNIIIGFGAMIAYINLGRYLEDYPDYSTINETLKRSLPNVLRYLLGVLPIFVGFMLFGLCVFWKSERFSSISSTIIALFSLINGDSIYLTFSDLKGISYFLGQIYLYLFCLIFIVVVINVFVAILEEAYITIKIKNRKYWIYAYFKSNDNENKEKNEESKKPPKKSSIRKNKSNRGLDNSLKRVNTLNEINKLSLFKESYNQPTNALKKRMTQRLISIDKVELLMKDLESQIEELSKICDTISHTKDQEQKKLMMNTMEMIEKRISNIKDQIIFEQDD